MSVHVDPASDTYAKIYLSGTSGAQGFNEFLVAILDPERQHSRALPSLIVDVARNLLQLGLVR